MVLLSGFFIAHHVLLMSDQITVIDNALDEEDYKQLEHAIRSHEFPWYFGPSLNFNGDNSSLIDSSSRATNTSDNHFFHELFTVEDGIKNHFTRDLLFPALKSIGVQVPFRVKANCNILTSNPRSDLAYHIDNPFKGTKTSILYFDDCNGYTIFKDSQKKVTSKRNRLVTFPSDTYHTGVPQTDTQRRILVNINYI